VLARSRLGWQVAGDANAVWRSSEEQLSWNLPAVAGRRSAQATGRSVPGDPNEVAARVVADVVAKAVEPGGV